jgi:RNA polymerase sigma factor (sigma-70 family)
MVAMTLSPTDWELIVGCREGHVGAWEQLVSRYERLIYSIALSYRLTREDAADVAQTAFLALFRSLGGLREETRLSAWLATVAHRQSRRLLQSRRYEQPDTLDTLDELAPLIGAPDSNPMERWELVEWLDHGMSALNERCRRLLLALYFDSAEPSYAEVAATLGIPVGSIGPSRARCLAHLKAALQSREV